MDAELELADSFGHSAWSAVAKEATVASTLNSEKVQGLEFGV